MEIIKVKHCTFSVVISKIFREINLLRNSWLYPLQLPIDFTKNVSKMQLEQNFWTYFYFLYSILCFDENSKTPKTSENTTYVKLFDDYGKDMTIIG